VALLLGCHIKHKTCFKISVKCHAGAFAFLNIIIIIYKYLVSDYYFLLAHQLLFSKFSTTPDEGGLEEGRNSAVVTIRETGICIKPGMNERSRELTDEASSEST